MPTVRYLLVTSILVSPAAFPGEDEPAADPSQEIEESVREEVEELIEEVEESVQGAVELAREALEEALEQAREAQEEAEELAREAQEEALENAREAREETEARAREAEEEEEDADDEEDEDQDEEEEEGEDAFFPDRARGKFKVRIPEDDRDFFLGKGGGDSRKQKLADKVRLKEDKVRKKVIRREGPNARRSPFWPPLNAPPTPRAPQGPRDPAVRGDSRPLDREAIEDIRRDLKQIEKRLDRIEALIEDLHRARETAARDGAKRRVEWGPAREGDWPVIQWPDPQPRPRPVPAPRFRPAPRRRA